MAESKPRKRVVNGITLIGTAGEYKTEDGRYRVFEDTEFLTSCDEPHPVRLKRSEWTSEWSYETGQMEVTKGYQCPGGETHNYTRWSIWDDVEDDYAFDDGPGAYLTLAEAGYGLAKGIELNKAREQDKAAELLHRIFGDAMDGGQG